MSFAFSSVLVLLTAASTAGHRDSASGAFDATHGRGAASPRAWSIGTPCPDRQAVLPGLIEPDDRDDDLTKRLYLSSTFIHRGRADLCRAAQSAAVAKEAPRRGLLARLRRWRI